MKAEEFKDKLEDFLNQTVGKSWQWLKEDEQDNTLIIKSLCVWDLEFEEEEVA
tara:strand:- start:44 stop:202 length:159 start_codon:yes stop_codon:yes gene_type:complete